ncbi:acyl-CoA N-acyltransferase [Xylariaceae sp. FL0016]|nr:acyl-CoA N-acyltransferase [Xylariaceae sp. FL0016]
MAVGTTGQQTPAHTKVKVLTTIPADPMPSSTQRPPIHTPRLTIRPMNAADISAIHSLRAQPEVMQYTSAGRPERDEAESQVWLNRFLPPRDVETYNFALCDRVSGELVGVGGVHTQRNERFGWPEVGYMLKKEWWGKGLATEFLGAFLRAWWALERKEVELEVHWESIKEMLGPEVGEAHDVEDTPRVPEMLFAIVESNTPGSARVLEKTGFEQYAQWEEPDIRYGREAETATLKAFRLMAPSK